MNNNFRDLIAKAIDPMAFHLRGLGDAFADAQADIALEAADRVIAALRPVDAVKGTEPLIVYFGSDADRDEFIAALLDVKPDMRAVKV